MAPQRSDPGAGLRLPSFAAGGRVTHEVGWFACPAPVLADELARALGSGREVRRPGFETLEAVVEGLAPHVPWTRTLLAPVGADWSVMMNNGPLGTDCGLLPSYAASELGCIAIRAVAVDPGETPYPGRILEVYDPRAPDPRTPLRTIAAANDGGRWVFSTTGEPLPFEETQAYSERRKRDRFTTGMLYRYLLALGVPLDVAPDWRSALLVARPNDFPPGVARAG